MLITQANSQMQALNGAAEAAGEHLDFGAMQNLSVTVEKALGLFVHKEGAKLVANQGDIEVQAQHSKNGIEHGSEGMMIMKVATYLVPGTPASLPCDTPDFPLTSLNPDTNNEPGTDNSDSSENDDQHRQNQPEKDPAKVRPLSRNGKVLDLQLTMIQRAIVLSVTDI